MPKRQATKEIIDEGDTLQRSSKKSRSDDQKEPTLGDKPNHDGDTSDELNDDCIVIQVSDMQKSGLSENDKSQHVDSTTVVTVTDDMVITNSHNKQHEKNIGQLVNALKDEQYFRNIDLNDYEVRVDTNGPQGMVNYVVVKKVNGEQKAKNLVFRPPPVETVYTTLHGYGNYPSKYVSKKEQAEFTATGNMDSTNIDPKIQELFPTIKEEWDAFKDWIMQLHYMIVEAQWRHEGTITEATKKGFEAEILLKEMQMQKEARDENIKLPEEEKKKIRYDGLMYNEQLYSMPFKCKTSGPTSHYLYKVKRKIWTIIDDEKKKKEQAPFNCSMVDEKERLLYYNPMIIADNTGKEIDITNRNMNTILVLDGDFVQHTISPRGYSGSAIGTGIKFTLLNCKVVYQLFKPPKNRQGPTFEVGQTYTPPNIKGTINHDPYQLPGDIDILYNDMP